MPECTVKIERTSPKAIMPKKANDSDACFDLFLPDNAIVEANSSAVFDIGIAIEMPEGWEAQVRGRSGLAKKGILVHNGTIDYLYRQNIGVIVHNLAATAYQFSAGDRIAQLKFSRVWDVVVTEAKVTPTSRGGFGSTGR